MLKRILLIVACVSSIFEAKPAFAKLAAREQNRIDRIALAKCLRGLVEWREGGREGLSYARILYGNARSYNDQYARNRVEHRYTGAALLDRHDYDLWFNEASRDCSSFQARHFSHLLMKKSEAEKILKSSPLTALYHPKRVCRAVTAEVGLAVGLSGAAGLGAMICQSTNGRRYVVASLTGTWGFGAGANAVIRTRGRIEGHSGLLTTGSKTLLEDGYGEALEQGLLIYGAAPQDGALAGGVGLGFNRTFELKSLDLKIMRLPENDDVLLNTLDLNDFERVVETL